MDGVLATGNARLLLATRLAGQASDGLLQAALGTFILFSPQRQATAPQVAATFAVLLLPYSLVGPLAGVLLDRWSRTRVLVVANLGRAAVMVVVAVLVARGSDGLGLGATLLVALGLGRLVLAGLSAGLPHTVAPEHLVTANALFPTAGTITSGLATVVGLGLMAVFGTDAPARLLLVVVAGLIVAAAIARRIPPHDLGPDEHSAAARTGLTQDVVAVVRGMVAGVAHVHHRHRARRAMGVVIAHRVAFGTLLVTMLVLLRNTLNPVDHADAALADFAITGAAAALGALVAALVTPGAVRRFGQGRWSAGTLLAAAVVTPLGLASLSLAGLVAGSAAMGLAGQAVKICGDTTLQSDVDDLFRGRVFSLYDVGLNLGLVAGMLLAAFTLPPDGVWPPLWAMTSVLLAATAAWSLRPTPVGG